MIGKAIASQTNSLFFSVSSSTLMSKWIGEGEKLVRTLFSVAGCKENSIVFVDEIDSLLTSRSEGETEASRRIKNEFLVQLDGLGSDRFERTLLIGATNRPQELDEAVRRRMQTRLYIPLPDATARRHLVDHLIGKEKNSLTQADMDAIVRRSEGYSGSDLNQLCRNAALGPLREIAAKQRGQLSTIDAKDVRAIGMRDFDKAFRLVKATVLQKDLDVLEEWNRQFGTTNEEDMDDETSQAHGTPGPRVLVSTVSPVDDEDDIDPDQEKTVAEIASELMAYSDPLNLTSPGPLQQT